MKAVYKFVAGNSRITPIGIALAILAAVLWKSAPVYLAVLVCTLAAATAEPVQ